MRALLCEELCSWCATGFSSLRHLWVEGWRGGRINCLWAEVEICSLKQMENPRACSWRVWDSRPPLSQGVPPCLEVEVTRIIKLCQLWALWTWAHAVPSYEDIHPVSQVLVTMTAQRWETKNMARKSWHWMMSALSLNPFHKLPFHTNTVSKLLFHQPHEEQMWMAGKGSLGPCP